MHDFGWKCSPVERAGTEAPPMRGAGAAPAAKPMATAMPAATLTPAKPAPAPKPAAAPAPRAAKPAAPAAKPVAAPASKPAAATKPATGKPSRPKKLSAARGGKADDLKQISGVGPKLEKTLNGLGFFHFDQIAAWNKDEVEWVDDHLNFKGRIDREKWIPQAKLLAAGDTAQHARKYGPKGRRS